MMMTAHRYERFARAAERWLPIGIVVFLALFAVRFADERLYSDSGYYLARVINEGSFRIEHGRWVLALSQVLPLAGVKLGLGLKTLIVLHSLNNVVWLAACVFFAKRVLHNERAAVLLACVHLIGLTHGLFCPIFELYYGVDLLVLFQFTRHADHLRPVWRWTLLIFFFVAAISSHFFALLLAAGLLTLDKIWKERRMTMGLAVLTVIVVGVRMATLSVYEQSGLEFLADLGDPAKVFGLFAPSRLAEMWGYFLIHYADILILLAATTFMLWRSHQRWSMFVLLAGLAILFVLSGLFLPGFIHDRYREQVNFATTAWILIVLITGLPSLARWPTVMMAMLVAASVFRIFRAEWIAPWYSERTALTEARIEAAREHHLTKGIVVAPVYFGPPHHLIDLSWSTSVESLLLSSKDGPQGTVSLITTEDLQLPEVRDQLGGFIFRRWDILDTSWLDQRYFKPPAGRYVPLAAPAPR